MQQDKVPAAYKAAYHHKDDRLFQSVEKAKRMLGIFK